MPLRLPAQLWSKQWVGVSPPCRRACGRAITRYLLSMASSSYTLSIVQGALNAGGGLITTHTAREWLFGFYDPLLELLSPADAYVYSFYNATSEDEARAHEGRWEFDTGKYDIIEVRASPPPLAPNGRDPGFLTHHRALRIRCNVTSGEQHDAVRRQDHV